VVPKIALLQGDFMTLYVDYTQPNGKLRKKNSVVVSQQANYTDRAIAAGQRS
jgi:hypothetical protein